MNKKIKKYALCAACIMAFGSVTAITVNAFSDELLASVVEKAEERTAYWGEIGEEYKITEYTSSVRVFDPNGNAVSVSKDGIFMLTSLGEYSVVYKTKTITITALAEPPLSEFIFETDETELSYIAGCKATLPAMTVTNEFYEFDYYYVDVVKNSIVLETFKIKNGKSPVYVLAEGGEFSLDYYVVDDRFEQKKKTFDVVVSDERHIFYDEILSDLQVGDTVEIGFPYGYYQKNSYEVERTMKTPDGRVSPLKNSVYVPDQAGEYTVVYKSVIAGEEIVEEQTFTVRAKESAIFVSESGNNTFHGLVDLPEWNTSEYEKGYLITSTSTSPSVRYSNIVDLSNLTKEDNLVGILPYTPTLDVSIGTLHVRLTDVYDPDNYLQLALYQPSGYSTALCVVSRNGKWYGMANRSGGFGKIDVNNWGCSVSNTYLNKEISVDGTSDAWRVQYDYEANTLFITTGSPSKQYVYLPLSDKGEAPEGYSTYERLPESCWFKGFTSGEVFITIELENNLNAGYYICELAGEKAEDMSFDIEENFLVFDEYTGGVPSGARNVPYTLPTVSVNPAVLEYDSLQATVKDPSGNTVLLQDGAFIPSEVGEYSLIYSIVVDGVLLKREYTFVIRENPTPIEISIENTKVAFGTVLPEPNITVSGGNGKLDYSYEVLLDGEKLLLERSGGYLINKSGTLTVVVQAKDITGYVENKIIEIEITDGHYAKLPLDLPKSVRQGSEWNVPKTMVSVFENGVLTETTLEACLFEGAKPLDMQNGKIIVPLTAQTLSVRYAYEYRDETYSLEKTVDVVEKEIGSAKDFLFVSNGVQKTMTEAGIVLSVFENGWASVPHYVSTENLVVGFGFLENTSALDKWTIVLQDSDYPAGRLTFVISDFDANKGTVKISLNGKDATATLSGTEEEFTKFAGDEETVEKYEGEKFVAFAVTLTMAGNVVNNKTSEKLFVVEKFESGAKFDGFSRNACAVSFEWESEQETEFILSQIANQNFNYLNDVSGWIDGDSKGPEIVLSENVPEYVSKGYVLTVPTAKGFDVLQGDCEVYVSLLKEGNEIFSSRSARESFEYVLDSYGVYALLYEAFDNVNNRTERRVNITVKDENPPILTVNGSYQTTVKVGQSVTVLGYTVTDNEGLVATEQIFVKDDALNMTFVEVGQKYKFTEKGIYEIVYRMLDGSGNMARVCFVITVK